MLRVDIQTRNRSSYSLLTLENEYLTAFHYCGIIRYRGKEKRFFERAGTGDLPDGESGRGNGEAVIWNAREYEPIDSGKGWMGPKKRSEYLLHGGVENGR